MVPLLSMIFQNAKNATTHQINVSNTALSSTLQARMKALELQGIPNDLHIKDGISWHLFKLILSVPPIADNFVDTLIRDTQNDLGSVFKGTVDLMPINYDNFRRISLEYGLEALQKASEAHIQPILAQYSDRQSVKDFIKACSPLNVVLDHENGRTPNKAFVSMALGQALGACLLANEMSFDQDLQKIDVSKPFFNAAFEDNGSWALKLLGKKAGQGPEPLTKEQAKYLNPHFQKSAFGPQP
ncbi:hypothetical protein ACI2KR_08865 [Pseudomonas luteola]